MVINLDVGKSSIPDESKHLKLCEGLHSKIWEVSARLQWKTENAVERGEERIS